VLLNKEADRTLSDSLLSM